MSTQSLARAASTTSGSGARDEGSRASSSPHVAMERATGRARVVGTRRGADSSASSAVVVGSSASIGSAERKFRQGQTDKRGEGGVSRFYLGRLSTFLFYAPALLGAKVRAKDLTGNARHCGIGVPPAVRGWAAPDAGTDGRAARARRAACGLHELRGPAPAKLPTTGRKRPGWQDPQLGRALPECYRAGDDGGGEHVCAVGLGHDRHHRRERRGPLLLQAIQGA